MMLPRIPAAEATSALLVTFPSSRRCWSFRGVAASVLSSDMPALLPSLADSTPVHGGEQRFHHANGGRERLSRVGRPGRGRQKNREAVVRAYSARKEALTPQPPLPRTGRGGAVASLAAPI